MNNDKKKHENWIAGLPVKPQPSVNTATLEKQLNLDPGRYEIDGLNLFFMVNHYETKPSEEVLFEAHREYADIQYVYEGEEFIGVAPLKAGTETVAYNPEKDIAFYEVKEAVSHKAAADRIFILFPEDLHQPGVMTSLPAPVKKVVIKVKLERD